MERNKESYRKSGREQVSLSEVHQSVPIPAKGGSVWRRLFAFGGPAYLISVGYVDPGNWATDLAGGSQFGYDLLWVLMLANLMAILLQTLSARLGIVGGKDLAQACRDHYSRPVTVALWLLCEVAIAACDLAEVLGTAIALNLLFGLKIIYGVILTALDVLVLLGLQRLGIRKLEAVVVSLVVVVGGAFLVEMFLVQPNTQSIVMGFVPHLTNASLFVAIGIMGATVMPHNLYLHSALVQTRHFEATDAGRREACKYNLWDSAIALNGAFFINAAILILAASVFYARGIVVTGIEQAHELLSPLVGTSLGSLLFAIALLASGQSSTMTGTLAGQIVMEGFVNLRIRPVFRRLFTRGLAIVPAVLTIWFMGDSSTYTLLLVSQVILSMQLAFAIIPLIHFTSDRRIMGDFVNKLWVKVLAWVAAAIVIGLNFQYLITTEQEALQSSGGGHLIGLIALPVMVSLGLFLLYISIAPLIQRRAEPSRITDFGSFDGKASPEAVSFKRIGIAIERSLFDRAAVKRALTLARESNSQVEIVLIHIVVSVGAQIYGEEASDSNTRLGEEYLKSIEREIQPLANIHIHARIGFGDIPRELVRIARESDLDVLIMSAHGHRGLKDLLFGATISRVRHDLDIPILVVK